jgi:beta-lactam-binding protein with PASTA domain
VRGAHCRTGTIRHRYSKVKKNHVISQTPGHSRGLRNGAKINLLVSKGKRL